MQRLDRDAAGRMTAIRSGTGTIAEIFEYDALDRLKEYARTSDGYFLALAYDASGNRRFRGAAAGASDFYFADGVERHGSERVRRVPGGGGDTPVAQFNNPYRFHDPTGLFWQSLNDERGGVRTLIGLGIGAAAGVGANVVIAVLCSATGACPAKATEEELEQARVRCWNHLEAHGYGSEIEAPEAIAIRASICALYSKPSTEDAVELLEWFLSLVNRLSDRSAEELELLREHFPVGRSPGASE